MKKEITFISDTHGKHYKLTDDLPGGWMIIHAGDVSNRGLISEINDFTLWFSKLPYEHKIFIAGNHDFGFENEDAKKQINIPDNVIYLQDSEVVIDGIKIYGSPWQPEFNNWAFNLKRGEQLVKKWSMIPNDTDILITHGPAFGMLDYVVQGLTVGCEDLVRRVFEINPKIHVFGHIHFSYGMKKSVDTTFINASSLGERYYYDNKPIVVDYDDL